MKVWLTLSSLGWKLLTFLGQGEDNYTCAHQYICLLIREACHRGTVGANIQNSFSSFVRKSEQNHSESNSQDICKVIQDYKKNINKTTEMNMI